MPFSSFSRRDFLRQSALAGAALGLAPNLARHAVAAPSPLRPYGAAVRVVALQDDAEYRAALAANCQVIVPEGEMKWLDLRPAKDQYTFEKADRIAAFAVEHRLDLRGHTLAWYGALPDWTKAIASRAEAEHELRSHIDTVVSRYRGVIRSWDVVNEPIPDKPRSINDIRSFVWSRYIGEDYMAIAFRAAAAADPRAQLVINEYDVEYGGAPYTTKREALRRIVRKLLDQKVPVHAVGLQAHLFADRAIDRDGLSSFAAEMHGLGLKLLVTELDVIDYTLPGDVPTRDALVAAKADEFLGALSAGAVPEAILTWGLSDRYTWLPMYFKRDDGKPNRPLPFDDAMRPKPLMDVINRYRRLT
jgi:endo-1,4-beta-xylanase